MEKIIFEGKTGCGKTFQAIKKAKELGKFIYLAPCRQLVYETAIKYGSKSDSISTGELKIKGENNIYAVYESLNHIDLNLYNSLIIDEAHFITDFQRGQKLVYALENFKGNIFLLTATRNFKKPKGFIINKLKPLLVLKSKKINHTTFFERLNDGVPSIYFHKYSGNVGMFGGLAISADTPADERLQAQIDFANGKINFIECTNVLAQGLNFPAENILIEYNEYDDNEVIQQKLGRLGRFGFSNEESTLTYCLSSKKQTILKNKEFASLESRKNILDNFQFKINQIKEYISLLLENIKFLKSDNNISYNQKEIFEVLEKFETHQLFDLEMYDTVKFNKYSVDSILAIEHLIDLDVLGLNQNQIDNISKIKISRQNLKTIVLSNLKAA